MGLSGRPRFPTIKVKGDPHSASAIQARVTQAESFFLDSFEDFAVKENLGKFTMIGHSLGGYLSTAYAFKYPKRVERLVLVSPVGIPKSPYRSDEEESLKAPKNVERELEEDQLDTVHSDATATSSESTTYKPAPDRKIKAPSSWWTHLWEANISPFSIVRMSTFAGPKLVSRYASRRFALFEPDVQGELFNYLYGVYGQAGSGEYCLAHLLSPGAFARWPLLSRFEKLDSNIPVSFIYGDHDWMDKNGGENARDLLRRRKEGSELQKKRTKGKVVSLAITAAYGGMLIILAVPVLINPHAGHWVFLEYVHPYSWFVSIAD